MIPLYHISAPCMFSYFRYGATLKLQSKMALSLIVSMIFFWKRFFLQITRKLHDRYDSKIFSLFLSGASFNFFFFLVWAQRPPQRRKCCGVKVIFHNEHNQWIICKKLYILVVIKTAMESISYGRKLSIWRNI